MNLIPQIKTAIKESGKPSVPATEPPAPVPTPQPVDDFCDLEALAGMLQQLQTRNQQYQRAIDALVAARRVVNGWDPKPEPELNWSVRRDVLAAMGDVDALARFDRDHAQNLAAEQAARHAATQQALEVPARVKALEQYITDLAAEMARDVDEGFIFEEMIESSLTSAFRLTHYSIQGDRRSGYEMALIGKATGERIRDKIAASKAKGM